MSYILAYIDIIVLILEYLMKLDNVTLKLQKKLLG